jgi:hypothetical protein
VRHFTCRFGAGVLLLLALVGRAPADDKRDFFDKPTTPQEYWDRIKFEINVGKFDFAADFLKDFIASLADLDQKKKGDADKFLVGLEDKEGMSRFLRLRLVPPFLKETEEKQARLIKDPKKRRAALDRIEKEREAFADDVEKLIKRVQEAVHKVLTDPVRIRKFIANLNKTPQERNWAITQLARSREAAVPYLLEALQRTVGRIEHGRIMAAMAKLPGIDPPLWAALELKDKDLRKDLLVLIRDRANKDALPYLWYLYGSEKVPAIVRTRAAATIGALLKRQPDKLTPAKVALTELAEKYYRHQVRFPNPREVVVWRYDPKKEKLVTDKLTANQAEEYLGLRFARLALDLDPTYKPAQRVFLSLALDKAYGSDIDLKLGQKSRELKELMTSIRPELVSDVLDEALKDHRLPVILGAVQTLGELADVKAGVFPKGGAPVLVKALNYPDRRVQMAAAEAVLALPGKVSSKAATRVVEILRRMLLADPVPKVAVAYFNEKRGEDVAAVVKQAGYEPVILRTRKALLRRLKDGADIDLVLIDYAFPQAEMEFPFVLAELRSDVDAGLLPVLVTAPAKRELSLRRLTDRYRNVWVVPESLTLAPNRLKAVIGEHIEDAQVRPLSKKERENFTETARTRLLQMANGEYAGYDVRLAEDAVYKALRSNNAEAVTDAIAIVGKFPGQDAQRALAMLVLDPSRDKLRRVAALQLNRHIQKYGLLLPNNQVKQIRELYDTTDDARLKATVALVVGTMRPSTKDTGNRLKDYRPPIKK